MKEYVNMSKNNIELVYEEESTVKFLRAEALYKNCIENPNNENCLNVLCNEARGDNLWARVRYIELQLCGLIRSKSLKIEKPKKQLKELAQDHFWFAQLKWAQYILSDQEAGNTKWKKAVNKLMELTDKRIYCADAYYYLGLFYMDQGECEKGEECLIRADSCGNKYAMRRLNDIDKSAKFEEPENNIDQMFGDSELI